MSVHFRSECKHGTVVSQCRCADPNKTVKIVPCPWDCLQKNRLPLDHVDRIAKAFHNNYEELTPHFGYKTRETSAKPWDEVPDNNRFLMCAVIERLIGDQIIQPGAEL